MLRCCLHHSLTIGYYICTPFCLLSLFASVLFCTLVLCIDEVSSVLDVVKPLLVLYIPFLSFHLLCPGWCWCLYTYRNNLNLNIAMIICSLIHRNQMILSQTIKSFKKWTFEESKLKKKDTALSLLCDRICFSLGLLFWTKTFFSNCFLYVDQPYLPRNFIRPYI